MVPLALTLPFIALALVVLIAFLVVAVLVNAFRDAGFTFFEAILIVGFAPLAAGWNFVVYEQGNLALAINVAGFVVPFLVSARIVGRGRAPGWKVALGAGVVSASVFMLAEFVPGEGVRAPVILLVGLAAAVGLLLAMRDWQTAPLVAYASGTIGVIVGADLMRIPEILALEPEAPVAYSIGGAGTLDGIFLVGIGAVALQLLLFWVFRR